MKILAFAATISKNSINKQLVTYAAKLAGDHEIEVLDLNDYELPIFSDDRESELGQPQLAQDFLNKIKNSDVIMVSFAEYNGSYSAAYKNTFDWASRINPKVFQNKPMMMLATSPGPGGASNVLATAISSAPYFEGNVLSSLSIPRFYENYDADLHALSNTELNNQLILAVKTLTTANLQLAS